MLSSMTGISTIERKGDLDPETQRKEMTDRTQAVISQKMRKIVSNHLV